MSITAASRAFTHVLIDLDDTLYHNAAIPQAVRTSIQRYMVEKLGIPESEVVGVTDKLYREYGTTMAGLVVHGHTIDYDDWHAAVHHTLDYQSQLHEDPHLRQLLFNITAERHILTNADAHHAAKCLHRLGLEGCFQSVFCFENVMQAGAQRGLLTPSSPVLCKPSPAVYQLVLEQLRCDPAQAIFVDDSVRNVAAAHQLGIFTVLVGPHHPSSVPGADVVIPSIHHLPAAVPGIFQQDKLSNTSSAAIPIIVTA